ncbi:MAG: hypothetical protein JJV98_07165 [Desulfosarcina sp.]|nr:hypothetical protein [Desulfobacterales bacterium]
MSWKHVIVTACLLCLPAGRPALGAEARFDGNFWRQSNQETRQLFVYGFMSGVVQGQDRVASRLLMKAAGGDFRPECHKAVSKNANVLESELALLDRAQFMAAMDAFYGLKKNRPLELKWAVLVVMQQLKGTPRKDLQRYIEQLRQQKP